MTEQAAPFFLIVADLDREFFCVEGPMTDNRPWRDAAKNARNNQRRIECGPTGPDRDALAAEYGPMDLTTPDPASLRLPARVRPKSIRMRPGSRCVEKKPGGHAVFCLP
jgi:hypothetical protein